MAAWSNKNVQRLTILGKVGFEPTAFLMYLILSQMRFSSFATCPINQLSSSNRSAVTCPIE